MAWDKGESESRTEDGRIRGQAHPDWQLNVSYLNEFLKRKNVIRQIEDHGASIEWCGVGQKSDGGFETLTHCGVFWNEPGKPMQGFCLSFHFSHSKFIEECFKLFGIQRFKN